MLKKIQQLLEKALNVVGFICSLLLMLLTATIIYNVVLRYLFNDVSIGLQEMEWHLFSALFLLGISYAIITDGHVRVDFIFEKKSDRYKNLINMIGSILFIIPLSLLIVYYSFSFALEAFLINEISSDPGGLHYRFIIKSVIPLSFVLVILAALQMFMANLVLFLEIENKAKSTDNN